jgi:hypothetical protein
MNMKKYDRSINGGGRSRNKVNGVVNATRWWPDLPHFLLEEGNQVVVAVARDAHGGLAARSRRGHREQQTRPNV